MDDYATGFITPRPSENEDDDKSESESISSVKNMEKIIALLDKDKEELVVVIEVYETVHCIKRVYKTETFQRKDDEVNKVSPRGAQFNKCVQTYADRLYQFDMGGTMSYRMETNNMVLKGLLYQNSVMLALEASMGVLRPDDFDSVRFVGDTKELFCSSGSKVYKVALPLDGMKLWEGSGRTVTDVDPSVEKDHMNPFMDFNFTKEQTDEKNNLVAVKKDREFFDCTKTVCGLDVTTYVLRSVADRNIIVAVDFNKEWPEEYYAGYPSMTLYLDLKHIKSQSDMKIEVNTKATHHAQIVDEGKMKRELKIEGLCIMRGVRSWDVQIVFSGFQQDIRKIFPSDMKVWIAFEQDPIKTQMSFSHLENFNLVTLNNQCTEVLCTVPQNSVPGLKVEIRRKCLLGRMEFLLNIFPKKSPKVFMFELPVPNHDAIPNTKRSSSISVINDTKQTPTEDTGVKPNNKGRASISLNIRPKPKPKSSVNTNVKSS